MHAFLLTGTIEGKIDFEIEKLTKNLKAKKIDYPISKIEDVRNLGNFIRLSFDVPTLIVCKNIDVASEETLNAFLKNLEEPQENIYFVLTAKSTKRVLPTIVSRCQIIKTVGDGSSMVHEDIKNLSDFFNMDTGNKFTYIDKIKSREDALKFIENTAFFLHSMLGKNTVKYSNLANNLETALKTYSRLKANGNVNLQLSNLAINFKEEYA